LLSDIAAEDELLPPFITSAAYFRLRRHYAIIFAAFDFSYDAYGDAITPLPFVLFLLPLLIRHYIIFAIYCHYFAFIYYFRHAVSLLLFAMP